MTAFKFWCCLAVLVISKQISPELKCLTVLVVCERVLNDLKRFDTNLVNNLFKNTFFLVLGHENHFYTVLSVFTSF